MISRQQVRHVARLARLQLSSKEEQEMTGQLVRMLDYFCSLQQLDTSRTNSSALHGAEMADMLRADMVADSLPLSQVLANAPARDKDLFTVPKVVDKPQ